MRVVCSWCGMEHIGDKWVPKDRLRGEEVPRGPDITHTICPLCDEIVRLQHGLAPAKKISDQQSLL